MMDGREELDLLNAALSRVDSYIAAADAKCGVIAAIATGFTAVLMTSEPAIASISDTLANPTANPFLTLLLAVACASMVASAAALFSALSPRVSCGSSSCIFFGEIAKHKDAASLIRELESDEYDEKVDFAGQVLVNSKICSVKMRLARAASISTAVSVATTVAYVVLHAIG